jgi:hypothetical protein
MKALSLALRTKAENVSLSWAVISRPDAEFYIPAIHTSVKILYGRNCQYLDQTQCIKKGPSSLRNPPDKSFVLELPASKAFCACAAKMATRRNGRLECLVVGWVYDDYMVISSFGR